MTAFRRLMTVLLIANLASGAWSVPALRHSHAMSEHTDDRHSATSHSHSHSHSHLHGHPHQHHSKAEPTITEPAVEHLHLVWFGIGLTLPVSPEDSTDLPNSIGQWVPLLGKMLLPQIMAASDEQLPGSFSGRVPAFAGVTLPNAEPLVPPKLSWLCDTARRERCGVLNI